MGSLSIRVSSSYLERWEAMSVFWRISVITLVPYDLKRPNLAWTPHVEKGIFLGSATPHPKWVGSQRLKFVFGTPYISSYGFIESNQIRHGNTWGKGMFLGVSHAPILKGRDPSVLRIFWGHPTFAHMLW